MKIDRAALAIATLALAITDAQTLAQSIYTPYAFTNFAGQPGGPGIADGSGSGARFDAPNSTAVDPGGNVYVVDQINDTIRRITPAGEVTTIAGYPFSAGTNDGVGSIARFGTLYGGRPTGIAVDSATNVYVADTPNCTIRKLVFDGMNWVVSTFAGSATHPGTNDGAGSVARFTSPAGMTTDSAGNIYVLDGFAVRRVTPAGAVTTLAGSVNTSGTTDGTNSVARFGSISGAPKGVAVDSNTNIYVADTYNSSIRLVSPVGADWVVTTFAGVTGFLGYGFNDGTNADARFANPYGIAVDKNGIIYVTDSPAQTIRKIVVNGTDHIVTTFAGMYPVFGSDDGTGSAARFLTPEGVSVDSAGNLYVADYGNNTIRKITPAGDATTLAGQAGGIGTADGVGNKAQFDIPHSVAVDSAGNVYVSDTFNRTIRKITPNGTVTTIAGSPGRWGHVDGVGTYQAPQFNSPTGISADTNGNLYVADHDNQTIRKITPAGVVTTLAGQAGIKNNIDGNGTNATFNSPYNTGVDSKGNIFVADEVNRSIRKITPGGDVTLFAGSPTRVQGTNDGVGTAAKFQAPEGLAIDKFDNLYVADQGASTIRKIAPDATVTTFAGLGKTSGTNDGVGNLARFNSPEGVAVDQAGNVYVADSGNDTIRKITPGGAVTTLAGSPGQRGTTDGTNGSALFDTTRCIAVDSATNLYVADAVNNCRIRKITLVGSDWVVTTLAGGGTPFGAEYSVDAPGTNAVFKSVYGLTLDSAGNIYAVDRGNSDIRKITPAGVVTTFAGIARQTGSNDGSGGGAQFDLPEELAVDSATNIYVVDFGDNTVRKISPNGTNWVVTTIAGCPYCPAGTNDGPGADARFNGPFGLTRDTGGNLYVADTSNFTIRKITPSGPNWVVSTFVGAPGQQNALDGIGTAARLSGPISLCADKSDNLYLDDGFAIRKITPGAVVTTLAGCPPPGCIDALGSVDGIGSVARFNAPRGIAVDNSGNLYVSDAGNDIIRKLTFDGSDWMVTTLGGFPGQASGKDGVGSEARFNQPTGIAVDSAGNVYVVNSGENNVVKGTPAGAAPVVVQFDTAGGGLTVSNGLFQMRITATSSGSVILETTTNLQSAWTPIQTNPFLPPSLNLSLPVGANKSQFFRARFMP